MNILILNVVGKLSDGRFVCAFPSRWDAGTAWKNPPYYMYELAYLSTLLKRDLNGANVKLLDPNWHDYNWEETALYAMEEMTPDILITECSALTYPDMTKVMRRIKLGNYWKQEGVKAWLCGPYGANNEAKALTDGWDMVFRGEYEQDILWELQGWTRAQHTEAGLMHRTIPNALEPGWSLKKPYIDLDWLPFPEDQDISRADYGEWSNPYPGMVQLYATRGCPLSCSFCVVPGYYGGHGHSFSSHRCRDIDNVCDEIEYLARKYEGKFSGCFFNEETHNANIEWFNTFAETLIHRGLDKYRYDAMCGYWPFTEDSLRLAARAGYCQIRIGIESTSENVGKKIGKRIIPEKLAHVLEWCKKYGIFVYGTTQVGAPGSTFDSDIATLQTMQELRQQGYIRTWQNSVSTPQPGTPMYAEALKEGRLLTEDVSQYDGCHPVMNLPGYPADKIMEAKRMFGA